MASVRVGAGAIGILGAVGTVAVICGACSAWWLFLFPPAMLVDY